mmetsp:Transcript_5196/g.9967  ORF Transcript_5196/g.9967 Transcript_5196/m.9967 type:complete len:174 (-) Transcript_5196:292-813(-)
MLTTTKLLTLVGRRSVPRHLARTCRVSNTVSTWWVRAWSAVPKTNEALSVEEMMVAIEGMNKPDQATVPDTVDTTLAKKNCHQGQQHAAQNASPGVETHRPSHCHYGKYTSVSGMERQFGLAKALWLHAVGSASPHTGLIVGEFRSQQRQGNRFGPPAAQTRTTRSRSYFCKL